MNIWNKVLLGLAIVAGLGLFYLAARTLKTEESYRTKNNQLKAGIEQAIEGAGPDDSQRDLREQIADLRVKLHEYVVDRGRSWPNVRRDQFSAETGDVSVIVEAPDPHRISDKMLLYVFDDRPIAEGGSFIGEFKVAGVNAQQIALSPTHKLSKRELDRVAASPGPWRLYERMPGDRHGLLEQQNLVDALPEAVRSEYARDGKPAEATDPEERVIDVGGQKLYDRLLRDYAILFEVEYAWMSKLRDLINSAQTDVQLSNAALEKVKTDIAASDQTIAALAADLERSKSEVATITAHREALDNQLAAVKAESDQTFNDNKRLAAQWTRAQFDASARINAWVAESQPSGR